MTRRTHKFASFGFACAVLLSMGITMPSCPGQQAMQQQIDTLTASNQQLTRKIQEMDGSLKPLVSDMGQVKQLLPEMTKVIQGHRDELATLTTQLKEMQARLPAAKGAKKATPVPKKK